MSEKLNPVTREEMFLAKAAGQDTPDLKPITRVERFLQNLIDHVKSIGTGGGGTGGGGAQSDWNAAEGEPGHVLNRPFYSEYAEGTILAECTPEGAEGEFALPDVISLEIGKEYTVNWNGVPYKCVAQETPSDIMPGGILLGDIGFMTIGEPITGEPFAVIAVPADMIAETGGVGVIMAALDGSESVTLSITGVVEIVHPIPEKYLPQNGMLYRDSNHRLYKTADTSNPDNRLIKSELLDMVNRGMQLWVSLTDDGATVYVPVNSVRITDIAAFVKAEYVNGSTSTYVEGHAFDSRYVE